MMQALRAWGLLGLYCAKSSVSSLKMSRRVWLSFSCTARDMAFLRKLMLNSRSAECWAIPCFLKNTIREDEE